jgi:hypothetical protein
MTALVVALTVAVGLLGLLVIGLLRSHAEILRQLHELGAGREETGAAASAAASAAPFDVRNGVVEPVEVTSVTGSAAADLSGVLPGDEAVALSVAGVAHDTLIAFLSSGCSTCETFWEVFGSPAGTGLPPGTRLVVVTKGPDLESETTVRRLAPAGVPVVMSTQAWEDYGVPGSPYFVLVDGRAGRVAGEGSASAWEQVVRLVGEAGDDLTLAAERRGGTRADTGDGAHREARADRELAAAGIEPGHPSLYATADDVVDATDVGRAPAPGTRGP